MKDQEEKGKKKELTELLEKEALFLEITRRLSGGVQDVFAPRSESVDKLAKELKACETDIVKRYFFPVDKTIDTFTDRLSMAREELIKASEEDRRTLLRFIEALDKEVMIKEEEITKLKKEMKTIRTELLTNS
ncbi:MAG TPA: hypothetical protein VMW67_07300 [Desulfobacteria bacterium]|nr:hypothetical protein [Desulfobacteria bacterium]